MIGYVFILEQTRDSKENYNCVIDGLSHCLWWTDSQVEVAYTMPSERCVKSGGGAYHVTPPTIVCSFDSSAENEHNFQSKKLQRKLFLRIRSFQK